MLVLNYIIFERKIIFTNIYTHFAINGSILVVDNILQFILDIIIGYVNIQDLLKSFQCNGTRRSKSITYQRRWKIDY